MPLDHGWWHTIRAIRAFVVRERSGSGGRESRESSNANCANGSA